MTIPKNTYKIPDTEIPNPQPYVETRPQNRHKIQQLKKIFTSILTTSNSMPKTTIEPAKESITRKSCTKHKQLPIAT